MSYVNVWLGIPEADHNELNNRRGTEDNLGPAKQFVNGQLDPAVVQNLYARRTSGPNTWVLWSVILDSRDGPFTQQVNAFRQEFPGVQVLGMWKPDGLQFGVTRQYDEQGNEVLVGTPQYESSNTLSQYMPDDYDQDGNPVPNPTVRDVNLPAGWAPRDFS